MWAGFQASGCVCLSVSVFHLKPTTRSHLFPPSFLCTLPLFSYSALSSFSIVFFCWCSCRRAQEGPPIPANSELGLPNDTAVSRTCLCICLLPTSRRMREASLSWWMTGAPLRRYCYWMQWNMTALGTGMSIVCGSPLPPSILLPLPPYREDIAAHVVTKTARGKIAVYSLDLSRVTALVCPV